MVIKGLAAGKNGILLSIVKYTKLMEATNREYAIDDHVGVVLAVGH